MKTAEFLDFSGGLTDRDIPGKTNRLSTADNVLLDADKKPYSRDGFDIFSSTAYQLAAAERVARLVSYNSDAELLAFQNKKAFAISAGAWSEVTGPNGLRAFPSNTADSLLEEAQWNKHCYIATNSGDPVVKMYRDGSNVMQLRTAGLPAFGAYTAGLPDLTPADGGLALAIALANDIRTQMIAHFGSNGATLGAANSSSTGHHLTHADLTAQASAASASTAATNLASLITLVNELRRIYSLHLDDAQGEGPADGRLAIDSTNFSASRSFRAYHMHTDPTVSGLAYSPFIAYTPLTVPETGNEVLYAFRHFLNFTMQSPTFSLPSDTKIAALLPYLNDLRDKWNYHTNAPMTHYNGNVWNGTSQFTQLGLHKTALDRVEPYTWAKIPLAAAPFCQFVIDLYTEYSAHQIYDMHMEPDTTWTIPAAISKTPTTMQGAIELLGWLCYAITYHASESGNGGFSINGVNAGQKLSSVVSGNPALSLDGTTGTLNQFKYLRVVPLLGLGVTPFSWSIYGDIAIGNTHVVSSSTAATPAVLTTSNNFSATQAAKQHILTGRHYHMGGTLTQIFDPRALCERFDALDFSFSTSLALQGFADLAKDLAAYLKAHTIELLEEVDPTIYSLSTVKINGRKYQGYMPSENLASSASGLGLLIHKGMNQTLYPADQYFLSLNSAILATNTVATQMPENRFTTAVDAVSWNYRMVFRYDYTVGSLSFTDRSAPSTPINVLGFANESQGGSTEKGKFPVSLGSIYVHTNTSVQNYATADTTNWRKEIYRTIDTGQLYYRTDVNQVVGDISNATTTYSDYSQDDYLVNQVALYTNGGISENDAPPLATALHYALGRMYYVKGNRLYQSIPGDFDSVPGDFFVQADEDLIGVSSTRNVVVAFGQNRIYRVAGVRDEFGNGEILLDPIFDRSGAISAGSIVKADNGIFFAGKDGFYFTDGYQCMRVTDPQDIYISYTNTAAKRARVQGAYDNVEKRVYWTIQTGSGSSPDKIWVLDLQYGINADETPITTFSTLHSFNPTALCFYGGALHFGDADGYTWKQTLDRSIDAKKDTAVAATSWNAAPIIWDVKSCNHDYGSMVLRKYFTRVTAQFEQQDTNLSVQINSDADKGRSVSALPVIRSRKLATASGYGDSKMSWVTDIYTTKAGDVVDEFRMFKGDGFLRANFRALQFTNAYTVIANSTEMGTITVGNVAGNVYSATLVSLVLTRAWPLYSVDYYLRLSGVDYPVTIRSSDSAIRFDATGLATPATGSPDSWELWGKPKGERMRMIGYTVNYAPCDDQETDFKGNITSAGTVAE